MNAKFKLEFTPKFERRLKSLDREIQVRILHESQTLAETPYVGKRLRGGWEGGYSLRVSDYRVVYTILQDRVVLFSVGHRRAVYE